MCARWVAACTPGATAGQVSRTAQHLVPPGSRAASVAVCTVVHLLAGPAANLPWPCCVATVQVCLLDLDYGLPVEVRDKALGMAQESLPESDPGKEYALNRMQVGA